LVFLFFESRAVVFGIRYLAAIDTRDSRYQSRPGYDVATWLRAHVKEGERVALGGWAGYPYFVEPVHLLSSESATELQWLWNQNRKFYPPLGTEEFWRFYVDRGFTYVLIGKNLLSEALQVGSDRVEVEVVFVGQQDAVVKLKKPVLALRS
jgi:hypothetical protein